VTEAEWLTGTDPTPMLEFLRDKATDRKLRLFAVASSRNHHSISWEAARTAVEVFERFADGLATRVELRKASYQSYGGHLTSMVVRSGLAHAQLIVQYTLSQARVWPKQSKLLRDIVGNPFRHAAADPLWLSSTAVSLAQSIYEDRAFDRLPILADALEEAGCDDPELLAHCRGDWPHVRGCWVVDLVLGKQ